MSTDKEKYYEPLKLMTPIRYQYTKKIILNKKLRAINLLQNLKLKYIDDHAKCHILVTFIVSLISEKCELQPLWSTTAFFILITE